MVIKTQKIVVENKIYSIFQNNPLPPPPPDLLMLRREFMPRMHLRRRLMHMLRLLG